MKNLDFPNTATNKQLMELAKLNTTYLAPKQL